MRTTGNGCEEEREKTPKPSKLLNGKHNFSFDHYSGGVQGEWMSHRKRRETKQQPSMLPGPAVHGCCLVSFPYTVLLTSTASTLYPVPTTILQRCTLEYDGLSAAFSLIIQLGRPVEDGAAWRQSVGKRFCFAHAAAASEDPKLSPISH